MPSYHLMNPYIYSLFHSRLKVLKFCLLLRLLLLLLGFCSLFLWDSSQNIHIRCDAYKERSFMHCDSDKNGKVGIYSLQKACKCACFRLTVYFFSSSYLYEEAYGFSRSQKKTTIDVNVLSVDRTKKTVNEDRKQQRRHISNRLFVVFFFSASMMKGEPHVLLVVNKYCYILMFVPKV